MKPTIKEQISKRVAKDIKGEPKFVLPLGEFVKGNSNFATYESNLYAKELRRNGYESIRVYNLTQEDRDELGMHGNSVVFKRKDITSYVKKEAKSLILDYVKEHKDATVNEISDFFKMSKKLVLEILI